MIKKIVFLSYLPLTDKLKADYFMDRLTRERFEVQYLDLCPLFFAKEPQVGKIDDPIVASIKSYKALRTFISEQDQSTTLYWSLITFESRALRLHRILTRYGCLTARCGWNAHITPSEPGKKNTLWNKIRTRSLRQVAILAYRVVANRWTLRLKQKGAIRCFDLVFCSGHYGYHAIGIGAEVELKKSEVVPINSTDYGNYLRVVDDPNRVVEGAYILFLDEYLPLHPDFAMLGIHTVSPEEYYPDLNRFFDAVEQQTGLPVVIAAHPKALRYKEEDFFEGRAVYFGQTASLVKDASYVLAHGSTSVGYVAMFEKPAAILLSQAIKRAMPSYYHYFQFYAQTFGLNILRFDEPWTVEFTKTVVSNPKAYLQYRYDFLTSPQTQNKQTEDIVVEAVKDFHSH